MSESEVTSESSSSSSSSEELGSDYDPRDFESSSEEDDSEDEDFEAPTKGKGKRKAPAKKKATPPKKKTKTAPTKKKTTPKKTTSKNGSSASKENKSLSKNKKSAPAKAKPAAKKKLTAAQCEVEVIKYLFNTNRPYSDKEIFDNMHKPMPYSKFRALLDKIFKQGKIGHRTNGKFKLYWPKQDQFETLSKEDMDNLDVEIVEKREMERELKKQLQKSASIVHNLKQRLTLDELNANLIKLRAEKLEKSKKVADLTSSSSSIDHGEREKLVKEIKSMKNMWRDRRNNCLDVFDQILEGSSKKAKAVYEEWGLETAEDVNGPTLKEFGNSIKKFL
jgi:hypothetical protein